MIKQYNFNNSIYTVTNCTLQDIPSHIERVSSYWKNTDINTQIKQLEKSVKENTAFKVIDDKGISKAIIYIVLNNNKIYNIGQSNLLWFDNKRMFAILAYYLRVHKNIFKLYFMPHIQKGIDNIPFKFIVQDSSIRLFYSHNTPLEIDLYSNKCNKLYNLHFKKYDIKEL